MAKTKLSTKPGARQSRPAARGRKGATEGSKAPPQNSPSEADEAGQTPGTKQALIIGLLQREAGATLDDLVTATRWLPHTTRAALTRLRQAGHVLDKAKGETGATVYRIAAPVRTRQSRKAA